MQFIKNTALLSAASSFIFVASTYADFPSFDDLVVGDTFAVSDLFHSDGVAVKLVPFQQSNGDWTDTGIATVSTAWMAHGYENELNTNNITAHYDFYGSIGAQAEVKFLFGEYGGNAGNINVSVNNDFRNVFRFIDLDGQTIGGCLFTVLSGGLGNDNGEVSITGKIRTLNIGGQELAVDVNYCSEAFEDLPLNAEYYLGDSFVTDTVPVQTYQFYFSDWSTALDGFIQVTDWNSACGEEQELWTNNINAVFLFDAVSPIENFRYQFGEFGGNINIGINGVFRNVENYLDIDGDVIGGVTFNVISGGAGNDCGSVECDGIINKFVIGGQEHTFDCLQWDWADPDIPGDINGDGVVNVEDLLFIIAAWGTDDSDADVNGDGVVNVEDLLAVIANWS
jgi:hypothetical protein